MTGGLPQPAVNKIPVKQAAIEIYWLMWEHRRRMVGWAIVPFVVCSVLIFFLDALTSSNGLDEFFRIILSLIILVMVLWVTISFQVAIHRLSYPGFDFDRGSYGAPLELIHKNYFLYSILLSILPAMALGLVYVLISLLNSYLFTIIALFAFIAVYIYIVVAFMLIFPEMAIGVKPDLIRVWWMLRGNRLRLILTIILTTVPVYILSSITEYPFGLVEDMSWFLKAIRTVIGSAWSLLILGLWACTLSICYFYVTGRQRLEGGTVTIADKE